MILAPLLVSLHLCVRVCEPLGGLAGLAHLSSWYLCVRELPIRHTVGTERHHLMLRSGKQARHNARIECIRIGLPLVPILSARSRRTPGLVLEWPAIPWRVLPIPRQKTRNSSPKYPSDRGLS